MHQTLANLSHVLRGQILLNADVQKLANSLMVSETPGVWQSHWEGPEDPVQYLQGLLFRYFEFTDNEGFSG